MTMNDDAESRGGKVLYKSRDSTVCKRALKTLASIERPHANGLGWIKAQIVAGVACNNLNPRTTYGQHAHNRLGPHGMDAPAVLHPWTKITTERKARAQHDNTLRHNSENTIRMQLQVYSYGN
eukprot:2902052-Amphidinium_carterae.1